MEIEDAIDRFLPEECRRLAQWFHEREQKQWDAELDRDSTSGRLDFLFEEAEGEEWPPAQ
jgi:hypothetical protein